MLEAYIHTMERDTVDIIGHPDDGRFPVDYEKLVKAAKETGTLLEINNSSLSPYGYRENTRENSIQMLKFCKQYGTKVVLGTDAHVDAAIGEYPYVFEVLEAVDFPEELVANTTLDKLLASLKRNKNLR